MIITNGVVFYEGKWIEGMDVVIENGVIRDVLPAGYCCGREVIDAQGNYVCPGFMDLHIHGCMGCDVMDATVESLKTIGQFLARHGTTSFLPTAMTDACDKIKKSLAAIHKLMHEDYEGAEVLGAHLEGPFINCNARGAQPKEHILPPDIASFEAMAGEYIDAVKRVTIAPELEGAPEMIQYLAGKGIVVSAGHTRATYDEFMRGISCGIRLATHFYNAMSPLRHREPGVVGAVLDSEDVSIELIADLVHVHPAALRLAIRLKGPDKTVLVTDAMAATGFGDGEYQLGCQRVFVRQGIARLEEGNLAGSTLTQDKALRNIVKIGVPLEDGIRMMTETPATIIGVEDKKGRLRKGYDADIVVLDKELHVVMTFVKGKRIF